jgi:hypothetical protein
MTLKQRLHKLERQLAGDCPVCHGWPTPVIYWSPEDFDESPPQPCAACGALPDVILFETVPEGWRPEQDDASLQHIIGWPPAHAGEGADEHEGRNA